MMFIGCDEVSRSTPIGSMFVCGLAIKDKDILDDSKIKDSKCLTRKRRDELYDKYHDKVLLKICEISPIEFSQSENINELEAEYFKHIVGYFEKKFDVDEGIIDKFSRKEEHIKNFPEYYQIEFKADENYKIVSLASIFAKHFDDIQRDGFEKQYGFRNFEALNKKVHKFICEHPDSSWIRRNYKTYKRAKRNNFKLEKLKEELELW